MLSYDALELLIVRWVESLSKAVWKVRPSTEFCKMYWSYLTLPFSIPPSPNSPFESVPYNTKEEKSIYFQLWKGGRRRKRRKRKTQQLSAIKQCFPWGVSNFWVYEPLVACITGVALVFRALRPANERLLCRLSHLSRCGHNWEGWVGGRARRGYQSVTSTFYLFQGLDICRHSQLTTKCLFIL